MRIFTSVLSIFIPLSALAVPQVSRSETCSVEAGSPPEMVVAPTLSVLSLTRADEFVLPSGLPSGVEAVVCERSSIVPSEFDYKVLQAGLPFAISLPEGATLWLELNDGQLAVSYKEATLSAEESSQIQEWLNRVQVNFYKDTKSK